VPERPEAEIALRRLRVTCVEVAEHRAALAPRWAEVCTDIAAVLAYADTLTEMLREVRERVDNCHGCIKQDTGLSVRLAALLPVATVATDASDVDGS
jgi:hypothetical protein